MDFWQRLVNRTPLSLGGPRHDHTINPARRLHRFERSYSELLQIWRNSQILAHNAEAAEKIEPILQDLTAILTDESRRPLPHPCIQLAALEKMYVPIGKIASSSLNEWVVREAVLFFATLVEGEEEAFVENINFSTSLTDLLVRITGVKTVRLDANTEARIAELAFNITTKIRLNPAILPAWFKAGSGAGQIPIRTPTFATGHTSEHLSRDLSHIPRDSRDKFEGRTQKRDFPLFYILMDYIHHEGKVGDFARTGLLYLIEATSTSITLEQWIIESDLSTLMATGLGALYSQLSRKLVIDHSADELPIVLALSDYEHPTSNFEVEISCSPEFLSHLDTFLSHLLFWQDVLNHCQSVDIKKTLLEHFQVIFLQQLLYPSLLESSDVDGGSSVAVLTYLRRILESLDHPDMIDLILHYLLALPDVDSHSLPTRQSSASVARERKSMDLRSMMAEKFDMISSPLLFNLVDLIHACLKSNNQQTIHVTLLLVSSILKRHHRYAITTLFRTASHRVDDSRRTIGAYQQDVEYFMCLAGVIGGQENANKLYDTVLRDTMTRLESHSCSLRRIIPTEGRDPLVIPDIPPGTFRNVNHHRIRTSDPLLGHILDILQAFFLNPVETNLSVTETIIDLGICEYTAVEGWLVRNPDHYIYDDEISDSDSTHTLAQLPADEPTQSGTSLDERPGLSTDNRQLRDIRRCRKRPKWQLNTLPRLLVILRQLCDQVAGYRETIPTFDEILLHRRGLLQFSDNLPVTSVTKHQQLQPVAPSPRRPTPTNDALRSTSPARPSAFEGLAQRILSEFGAPSRSSSPRGQKDHGQSSSSLGPSSAPSTTTLHHDRPSSHSLLRNMSPSRTDPGPVGVAASQTATSTAIDEEILARRIDVTVAAATLRDAATINPSAGRTELSADCSLDEASNQPPAEAEAAVPLAAAGNLPAATCTSTVSHVLTNTILLQWFLLELAGLVQVRASLYGDVRFI